MNRPSQTVVADPEVADNRDVVRRLSTCLLYTSVSDVIDVDFEVRCCPIDPMEFVRVLDAALYEIGRASCRERV